jgi:uncharacterized protein (DUF302 family)
MGVGSSYSFGARLADPLGPARERVVAALKVEGFGVLTEIDVAATLKAKLGVERDPYLILGACNPSFADRALQADPSIGALLPCNVVLRADGDGTVVEIMDPAAVLGIAGTSGIEGLAGEVEARLRRVIASLEAG